MSAFTSVRIDGELLDPATASIPVSDIGFIRGFGVFEVIRGVGGRCFRLEPHLRRLERSAAMLGIDLPSDDDLTSWSEHAATFHDDCMVRILVSAGDDPFTGTTRVVVTSEPALAQLGQLRLLPLSAPWHSDGENWELLRGKTLSYANNLGAIRAAMLAGFDDALLIGRSKRMLEGPTFTIGWVVEEDGELVYETPSMELGILDSITREVAFDAAAANGLVLREVEHTLDRLDDATEVFALSTMRDAVAVTAVGDRSFPIGPATEALRSAMYELTRSELSSEPTAALRR
jgi:branched-subunit amino acid aminotransferase/4-amino-4-deoxychorismate lyase